MGHNYHRSQHVQSDQQYLAAPTLLQNGEQQELFGGGATGGLPGRCPHLPQQTILRLTLGRLWWCGRSWRCGRLWWLRSRSWPGCWTRCGRWTWCWWIKWKLSLLVQDSSGSGLLLRGCPRTHRPPLSQARQVPARPPPVSPRQELPSSHNVLQRHLSAGAHLQAAHILLLSCHNPSHKLHQRLQVSRCCQFVMLLHSLLSLLSLLQITIMLSSTSS